MLKRFHGNSLLILLVCLTPLINVGLDIYTPSLPTIVTYFHTTPAAVKLSFIYYVVAFGIAQPIVGPLSDRFGRRYLAILALVVIILSALMAGMSKNMDELYAARIFQGVGGAMVGSILKAVLVDRFEGKGLAKANAYFNIAWGVTPIVAPAVGAYLEHYFAWQASFGFIAIYAGIALIMVFLFMPETRIRSQSKLKPWYFVWLDLLTDKVYMSGLMFCVGEYSILILYYAAAPFILQQVLGISVVNYGQIMLALGAAFFIGGWVNRWMLQYFNTKGLILTGITSSLIIGLFMILAVYTLPLSVVLATLPVFLIFIVDGLIFPNTMTICIVRYRHYSATAGSFLGGMISLFASTFTALINHIFHVHTIEALSIVFSIIFIVMLFLFFVSFRHANFAD